MEAGKVSQSLVLDFRFRVGRKLRFGNHKGKILLVVLLATTLSACVTTGPTASRRVPRNPYSVPEPSYPSSNSSSRRYDSYEVERLRHVLVPLLQGMDRPCRLDQVRIGIVNQAEINAANAGNCQFYITAGLLRRANDDQLRGVLAHEIAHEDLGHVAKAQVLGAGLNVLAAGLQQLFPAAGILAPVAGELVARGYGRTEEFAADRHGVDILRRAGYSKATMVDALTWIRRVSGDAGGGFLSTHPGLDDRIATVQRMQ
jgi:Zn-dependent protease with chaperone function